MIKRIGSALVLAGAVFVGSVGLPGAAQGQAKFEFTPFIGSVYALSKMCSDCGNDSNHVRGRLVNSAAIGGRLTYWVSHTVAIEAAAAYTPSRVEESAEDTTGFALAASAKGSVLLASGRVLFRPSRTNLHFIVGTGIVQRGGNEWKLLHDSAGTKVTSVAGILGVGVRAAVTPKFALDISAEGNFYSFDPKLGPSGAANGSKLQSDFVISIGVPITLSK